MTVLDRPTVLGLRGFAAGDLPALLLVIAPLALMNALIGTRPAGAPSPAEVDALIGAGTPDLAGRAAAGFSTQLSAAQAVAGFFGDASLLQTARGLSLLVGLATAVLLWPVVRPLRLGGDAAAAAVIVAGLAPLALHLQPRINPGALAAFWLVLGAVVAIRLARTTRTIVVAAAAAAAVATAPLAAVGLIAVLVHRLAAGLLSTPRWPRRIAGLALALSAMVGAAVLSILAAPSAGPGDGTVSTLTLLLVYVLSGVLVTRAWRRCPQLRVLAAMAVAWLLCAAVPGPIRLTALLLATPVLAVLVGALVHAAARERWPRFSIAGAGAVVVALVAGLTAALLPSPPVPSTYQPLAGWLSGELDPATAVVATPLDRAELVAAGMPPERFATTAATAQATVVASAADCPGPVAVTAAAGGGRSVCVPPLPVMPAIGALLARNPALTLLDPARTALENDLVDGRLASVLTAAAMTHHIEVIDFPAVPGEPADAQRRTAVLGGIDPAYDVAGRPAASALQLYLAAQLPPYRSELSTTPDGLLVVHFRIPSADVTGA